MLSETACPAYARYLYTDEYYTNDAIKTFQADCTRQHQGRKKGDGYERFVNWTRQGNELLIFTGRAYADLIVPKKFNGIFRLASPREYQLVNFELTQSILLLGGLHPFNSIELGHKHLCVLTFEEEVPALFGRLHKEDGSYRAPIENREQLGFCNARDLPAITERLEKVAQLRSQYGKEWWNYDELSA
ncbi:MAG TPA: hypothetical protein VF629_16630 [Hymenobacter sp.]|jgi:hypothetical protein|uniref:hypothetical protein n=1 Tax=Hymenobacter sp. TaxID=1898978 RepID=UPI002ED9D15F